MNQCRHLHRFADGELTAEELPRFQRHLGTCPACQRELRDLMMLDALATSFAGPPARASTLSRSEWSWWTALFAATGLAALAIAHR
jgi:anti-sigma factor RsiW